VPRLWDETIEAHRRVVRDATLNTTAALVAEHGLASVTMSQIAAETGIGRATLYKYFPDVEAILVAWHERQVAEHLAQLTEVEPGWSCRRAAYGGARGLRVDCPRASRQRPGRVATSRAHVAQAHQQLRDFVRDLLTEGAASGEVRDDVAPEKLASYCLHAVAAARHLPSKATVRRLVGVILAGLQPPR